MHQTSTEDFFANELIPTAQLIELLLALGKTSTTTCLPDSSLWSEPPPKRRRLQNGHHQWAAGVLYQPLHVVAVFVQSAHHDAARDIAKALQAFRVRSWDLLNPGSQEVKTRLREFIAGWTNPSSRFAARGTTASYLRAAAQRLRSSEFSAALQALEADIVRLTGYNPTARQQWLDQHDATRLHGVMANGRIAGWRTFVRNGDWGWLAQEAEGAYRDKAGVYRNLSLSTRVGLSQYSMAWTQTFRVAVATPAAANSGVQAEASDSTADQLPRGVTVVSNSKSGTLIVEAVYDPQDEVCIELRQALRSYVSRQSPELVALLRVRQFAEGCTYRQLVDAVERATDWQRDCSKQLQATVRQQVQAFVTAQKHAELRGRLLKQFTHDELTDLKEVLDSILAA